MHCAKSPKAAAALCARVSFGVSLLLVGIVHFMTIDAFKGMAMDGLGALEPLGALWAYVLPALMIVGGALIALGMYMEIGAWTAGIALGSIPAGMLLKPVLSGASLADMMPAAVNAFVWLIVFMLVIKFNSCGGPCKPGEGK